MFGEIIYVDTYILILQIKVFYEVNSNGIKRCRTVMYTHTHITFP